jgi:hypothetical protein
MELLHISLEGGWKLLITVSISGWLVITVVATYLVLHARTFGFKRKWKPVELEVNLGNVGKVKLCPDGEERQIAHKIWAELITRKAALPIDLENDVITEIYDSWYALFKVIRQLISDMCATDIPESEDKQKLILIATKTLNDGLRPHLTRWQARLRAWMANGFKKESKLSPQELQREFPQYGELSRDLLMVNLQLIEYAAQLKKLVESK